MITLVTTFCFLSCCLLTHTDTFPFPNCPSSIFMSYFIFHWVRVSSNDFSKSLLKAHGCEVIYRSTDKFFRELYHWRKCLNSSFPATIKYLNSWASGNPLSKTGCCFCFCFILTMGVCCTRGECVPLCSCRSQKTTLWTQLSFFNLI